MCIAEKEKLVKRLLKTQEPNDFGVFQVKLNDMGCWKLITLDSYFPCEPLGGPIYGNCGFQEYWILLIEKAFAKLYGSYRQLMSIKNPYFLLTGCPYEILHLTEYESHNKLVVDKLIEAKK